MLGVRLSAALLSTVATVLLIALFFGGTAARGAPPKTPLQPEAPIDIELAFDTTASMSPSIERAKRDGASIVKQVRDAFPDTRFAVVSFRDYGNPSGDYELVQPMTDDLGAVQAAFAKLRPASNPSPFNTFAEEYNLLLHKSYTDAATNWRPQARKVVVVIGDAQPHGARTSGLEGCTDTSVDYYGLNTADVLAGMRAAERTLLMIRQNSPETTASLGCYEAMAERAYAGGAALNGGDVDLAKPILGLIQSAVAPVTLRPDVGVALAGGSAGYTATVSNPNDFALSLRSVSVTLPAGFRHRSDSSTGVMSSDAAGSTKVSRQIDRVIHPSQKVSFHFTASVPKRRGRYAAKAVIQLQLPGGHGIASTGRASLRIAHRLRSLVVAARAQRPLQPSAAVALRGAVRIGFRPGVRNPVAGRVLAGRLVLGSGSGRSITLRVRSFRIVAFGSPTVLRLKLEVEHVRGMPACSPGARGSATFIDNQRFDAAGLRRDTVVTKFSVNCRIATGRWSNLGAAARSTVTATAQ
jgi:hypothetical protein